MQKFNVWDEKYLRPFFIYKYYKMKNRPQFELEDVLAEYQAIEEELNEASSEDEKFDMSFTDLQR